MNSVAAYVLYGALILPLAGPVLIGFLISFALVGDGARLRWLFISVPLFLIALALLMLLTGFVATEFTKTMWAMASVLVATIMLSPAAVWFGRHRKLPPKAS